MTEKQRIKAVYDRLLKFHGPQKCFLNHRSPFQLLIATILSAQCTDRTVNKVTPALFERYPDPSGFAGAVPAELEEMIHACGFFRSKAKNIIAACRTVVEKFNGNVPEDMEGLTSLPGVGRKTANVVLGDAYGVPGFPVDTHVTRLAQRIGLSRNSDPVKIEADLCKHADPSTWAQYSHLLIIHGRTFCQARHADCKKCPITDLCAEKKVSPNKDKKSCR